MTSGWRKARIALGLRVCISTPSSEDVVDFPSSGSGGALPPNLSPRSASSKSPSRLQLLRTSIRLSRGTCSICLELMKAGVGQALFTAECSHTFHFACIASNVRHGNIVCPVCRAVWKEVPWQAPCEENKLAPVRTRRTSSRGASQQQQPTSAAEGGDEDLRRLDPVLRILDESIASTRGIRRNGSQEPAAFDDDEPLSAGEAIGSQAEGSDCEHADDDGGSVNSSSKLDITCEAEVGSICYSQSCNDFTVLVHLKALSGSRSETNEGKSTLVEETGTGTGTGTGSSSSTTSTGSRAPIDLVTVLDISGSMAGTKLMLLKQAMGFVIRNLGPADRLSVVVFSSTSKRLFPLRRMVEEGRQLALRAIDSLVSTGGTDIAEGLKKGAQVLEDRRERNPIASIMLLSDGQDTYSLSSRSTRNRSFQRTVSASRHTNIQFPVHTFGFGADHDATMMHSIAEGSGGTFSFIQAEAAVQDAFAQCIGGLLSVVIQDVRLCLTALGTDVKLKSIQAGSYEKSVTDEGWSGYVKLGDLYAEEERDVLLELSIPSLEEPVDGATKILSVECSYREPVSQRMKRSIPRSLAINRPSFSTGDNQQQGREATNVRVDRQRNRLRTAEAILEAGTLADRGDLATAQVVLQNAKAALRGSAAAVSGDGLSSALENELTEIQVRMASRQMYERSGRAYALSAHSSHLRQRATARGDYVETHSRDYQTPSMVDMIARSQTLTMSPSAWSSGSIGHEDSLSRNTSSRVDHLVNFFPASPF